MWGCCIGRPAALPAEALGIDPGGQLGREDLDHHTAAERNLLGHEDAAHASAAPARARSR